jgi:nitrate reductase NapE component
MDISKKKNIFKKENIELFVLGTLCLFPILNLSIISVLGEVLGL